jgi:hypothetical protein
MHRSSVLKPALRDASCHYCCCVESFVAVLGDSVSEGRVSFDYLRDRGFDIRPAVSIGSGISDGAIAAVVCDSIRRDARYGGQTERRSFVSAKIPVLYVHHAYAGPSTGGEAWYGTVFDAGQVTEVVSRTLGGRSVPPAEVRTAIAMFVEQFAPAIQRDTPLSQYGEGADADAAAPAAPEGSKKRSSASGPTFSFPGVEPGAVPWEIASLISRAIEPLERSVHLFAEDYLSPADAARATACVDIMRLELKSEHPDALTMLRQLQILVELDGGVPPLV